jgi:hypothetical protein
VARTKSPAVAKRNDVIFAEWRRGAPLTALAVKYSISRQVVGRIVASYHPELEEDTDRSLYRGYMWRLFDEVQEIGEHPGWKMSPNGSAAYGADGEPALDTNIQIQAKDLQLRIIRELRLLDGRDKQQQRQTPYDIARQQADAAIAAIREVREAERRELEELRRQAGQPVVQGEVVREIEG